MSFAADFPDMCANLKTDERDLRCIIGSDQCVVDEQWFFIRGCLEIPVIGWSEPFLWGLWASVRQEVYDEISDSWTRAGRERTCGPFKGRLDNSLREYPGTFNLKLEILIQPVGTRPLFKVVEPDHPLGLEQQSGISPDRAMELASLVLHRSR